MHLRDNSTGRLNETIKHDGITRRLDETILRDGCSAPSVSAGAFDVLIMKTFGHHRMDDHETSHSLKWIIEVIHVICIFDIFHIYIYIYIFVYLNRFIEVLIYIYIYIHEFIEIISLALHFGF